MSKQHLKRIAAPKTWPIKRKGITFITRPLPGKHSLRLGMPINVVMNSLLNTTKTTRETEKVLYNKEVLIDGRKVKDKKTITGFMDVISIPILKENYRMSIDEKGWIFAVSIDEKESKIKVCKIEGKSIVKGKTQLNLSDGRNMLTQKNDFKVGDSIVISVPEQEIKEHIKFDKGAMVILLYGKHTGKIGNVIDIKSKTILCKTSDNDEFETIKDGLFVIGKDKPAVKIR